MTNKQTLNRVIRLLQRVLRTNPIDFNTDTDLLDVILRLKKIVKEL